MSNDRPSLTVEVALWILIVAVALALRLAHLDAAPLNAHEASEAVLAWRAVTGQGMPTAAAQQRSEAGYYSPLLFVFNAFLFTLFGTGDGLARLCPALLGGALALTPFLLRQRIGRVGALAAGSYLALSPTVLFASRQLDGAVVAAVGVMASLGGLVCFFDTGRRAWLTLSAGSLALAVTSSPSAYGLLLVLGLAWLSLALAWPGEEKFLSWYSSLTHHASRITLVFLLSALAFSTGLGWNLTGLGAAGDLLSAWIACFGPVSNSVASPLILVAVYEPLALLLGLAGLAWGIRRGHRFSTLLGLWAVLGVLLLILMPGRTPLDLLWVVLPLALLTGVALRSLVQSLRRQGEWLGEGLYVPVVVILWIHFYLMLARYAASGTVADLALVLLAVVLQSLLAVVFAFTMRFDSALRAVAVGTGIVLLAATLSAGWGVAYVRPADPRELLVREPTAVELRDLVQTLRELSWREMGMPATLPFTLVMPDETAETALEINSSSVLIWYLRDFAARRGQVDGLDVGGKMSPVLVTTQLDLKDTALTDVPDDAAYVGQDFVLRRGWDLTEIGCTWEWPPRCHTVAGWLLFRNTPSPPVADQFAALWLLVLEGEGE
jgi:uncharacterized protein (TIGR03663 family)